MNPIKYLANVGLDRNQWSQAVEDVLLVVQGSCASEKKICKVIVDPVPASQQKRKAKCLATTSSILGSSFYNLAFEGTCESQSFGFECQGQGSDTKPQSRSSGKAGASCQAAASRQACASIKGQGSAPASTGIILLATPSVCTWGNTPSSRFDE
jgi:hypothetical protein